jgi:hypothetical protein
MYDYPAKRSDKFRDKGDDGDTILFWMDEGLNDAAEEPIRLAGVTAPESYQLGGRESAAMLDMICKEVEDRARAKRIRWAFMVYTHPNAAPEPVERRSFARWEGMVWAFDATSTGDRRSISRWRRTCGCIPSGVTGSRCRSGRATTMPDERGGGRASCRW